MTDTMKSRMVASFHRWNVQSGWLARQPWLKRRNLSGICASHDHVHRKREDILAEFLLDQHAAGGRASTSSK